MNADAKAAAGYFKINCLDRLHQLSHIAGPHQWAFGALFYRSPLGREVVLGEKIVELLNHVATPPGLPFEPFEPFE